MGWMQEWANWSGPAQISFSFFSNGLRTACNKEQLELYIININQNRNIIIITIIVGFLKHKNFKSQAAMLKLNWVMAAI